MPEILGSGSLTGGDEDRGAVLQQEDQPGQPNPLTRPRREPRGEGYPLLPVRRGPFAQYLDPRIGKGLGVA